MRENYLKVVLMALAILIGVLLLIWFSWLAGQWRSEEIMKCIASGVDYPTCYNLTAPKL